MTARSVQHATFVIERIYPASPARVFAAFAEPEAKARWFAGPPDKFKELERKMDFSVGGRERLKGRWDSGVVSYFDCRYQDIVPNERIVYAYNMHLDDKLISVSLATVELKLAGSDSKLLFTEQAAFLDGYDDSGSRQRGTGALLDRLAALF